MLVGWFVTDMSSDGVDGVTEQMSRMNINPVKRRRRRRQRWSVGSDDDKPQIVPSRTLCLVQEIRCPCGRQAQVTFPQNKPTRRARRNWWQQQTQDSRSVGSGGTAPQPDVTQTCVQTTPQPLYNWPTPF